MAAPQRSRSYAGILLLMYVLSSGAASRVAAEAQTTGEKFGAYAVPFAFLAFGVYASFKNGGRVAKTVSSILVGVLVAAFGVGLYRGYEEHRVPSEVNSEIEQLQAGFAMDLSSEAPGADVARQSTERTQAAARRLQASDDPKAVEMGRAMELISGLASESDARFFAAVDELQPERLLDVGDMVSTGQFEWRREALAEYSAASRNAQYNVESLPERVQAMLIRERISDTLAEGMLAGVRETHPLALEVWRQHEHVADAYLEVVDVVAKHSASITVYEDGQFEFPDVAAYEEFEGTMERAITAEERLGTAISRLAQQQQQQG
jgi:hypothetical protein